ncbi:MAG: hypothetical protein JSU82_07120, partial [Rhodospirillales bacterium]
MQKLIDIQSLEAYYAELIRWVVEDLLVLATLGQAAVILAAILVALPIAPGFRRLIERLGRIRWLEKGGERAVKIIAPLALPIVWLILQWISVIVAAQAGWPHHIIQITVSLLTAWVVIRFASQLVRDPTWSRMIAIVAWAVAALNIVGLLDDTILLLDSLALQLGELRISALT